MVRASSILFSPRSPYAMLTISSLAAIQVQEETTITHGMDLDLLYLRNRPYPNTSRKLSKLRDNPMRQLPC